MDLNKILDEYLTNLVQANFGQDLAEDEAQDAKAELVPAFMKLFNARLVDAFSDEDLPQVEELVKTGKFEEIPQLAYDKGINLADLVQNVMIEFAELYRGEAPQAE